MSQSKRRCGNPISILAKVNTMFEVAFSLAGRGRTKCHPETMPFLADYVTRQVWESLIFREIRFLETQLLQAPVAVIAPNRANATEVN